MITPKTKLDQHLITIGAGLVTKQDIKNAFGRTEIDANFFANDEYCKEYSDMLKNKINEHIEKAKALITANRIATWKNKS